jgi:hypothetical protein
LSVDSTIAEQIACLRREVKDLTSIVSGRLDIGLVGIRERVENLTGRLTSLESIQQSFMAERRNEKLADEKRERSRVRVQVAVLGAVGATLSGVLLLLFQLATA